MSSPFPRFSRRQAFLLKIFSFFLLAGFFFLLGFMIYATYLQPNNATNSLSYHLTFEPPRNMLSLSLPQPPYITTEDILAIKITQKKRSSYVNLTQLSSNNHNNLFQITFKTPQKILVRQPLSIAIRYNAGSSIDEIELKYYIDENYKAINQN